VRRILAGYPILQVLSAQQATTEDDQLSHSWYAGMRASDRISDTYDIIYRQKITVLLDGRRSWSKLGLTSNT
jgi:hypothetical protein